MPELDGRSRIGPVSGQKTRSTRPPGDMTGGYAEVDIQCQRVVPTTV
jgi:hypothetical protein